MKGLTYSLLASLLVRCKRLKRYVLAPVKGVVRRQTDIWLPSREVREYRKWIAQRLASRKSGYPLLPPPGLLSVLTAVWDGSPVHYLSQLAQSIAKQNVDGACEWVVLDNGCSSTRLQAYLRELEDYEWVKIIRSPKNLGIMRGLRRCLEEAGGRYVLPVDADDLLYPDALRIVASAIVRADFPALLYTDEDKVIRSGVYQPYFKPDWDPVLLLNSAYTAHLGVVNRDRALALDAYTDPEAEGSPDWDLFVRFLIAGEAAIHIPEVLYSWRVHASSTADDSASKPYISSSQRRVLQRFLDSRSDGNRFSVESSPLLPGAHWHFIRKHPDRPAIATVTIAASTVPARRIAELAAGMAQENGYIHLIGEDVLTDSADWFSEALSLFELHANTVMIGGRIRNGNGFVMEAGRYFGFGGVCGCPDRGSPANAPGYFGQSLKQHSVSAVCTQFAVMKARFAVELLKRLPAVASLAYLGIWAGAHALKSGQRIVYSPFLSGVSDLDWDSLTSQEEQELFHEIEGGCIPDHRYYSRSFSLEKPF